ncbi:tetratricopeptide (TPR) repeat protein [Rhodoblastus sphagnicola]|nr:tetratricopeptide (TPR) repeat protein [Rhodoblastus sphagnicola]
MTPKVRALLTLLVEARGKMVSKEEIAAAVWPHENVSDESITRCAHQLRKLLGQGTNEDLLKTAYGRGYYLASHLFGGDIGFGDDGAMTDALVRAAYEVATIPSARAVEVALKVLEFAASVQPKANRHFAASGHIITSQILRGYVEPVAAIARMGKIIEAALDATPENADVLALRGWREALLGRVALGRDMIDRAIESGAHGQSPIFYRVWLLVGARQLDRALKEIDRTLRDDPHAGPLSSLRVWLTCCAGRYDHADRMAAAALKLRPDSVYMLNMRSVCASLDERHDEAIAFARRAVNLLPVDIQSLSSLSYAFARAGRLEASRSRLAEAMAHGRVSASQLAAVKLALGDREAAKAELRRGRREHCPTALIAWCDRRLAPLFDR